MVSGSDGDHQRCILDLPMKPETIQNKWLIGRNWNRRSLWVTAPKSLVQFDYNKAESIYLGAQGTFKVEQYLVKAKVGRTRVAGRPSS